MSKKIIIVFMLLLFGMIVIVSFPLGANAWTCDQLPPEDNCRGAAVCNVNGGYYADPVLDCVLWCIDHVNPNREIHYPIMCNII